MSTTERDRARCELAEKIQEQIRSIAHESRCYLEYLDSLNESDCDSPNHAKPQPIDRFQRDILLILHDSEFPASPPSPGVLTYAEVHNALNSKPGRRDRHLIFTALFAAEIENHTRHERTTTQISELGVAFERIGDAMLRVGLPDHAAFTFERARRTYLQVNDLDARIRCLYGLSQAKWRGSKRMSWQWIYLTALWATAGYGFRPWRLLPWIMVQFLVLATIHASCTGTSFGTSCYLIVVNYIDLSVASGLNVENMILTVDSYTGVLTTSVFFALLIRHWFR